MWGNWGRRLEGAAPSLLRLLEQGARALVRRRATPSIIGTMGARHRGKQTSDRSVGGPSVAGACRSPIPFNEG